VKAVLSLSRPTNLAGAHDSRDALPCAAAPEGDPVAWEHRIAQTARRWAPQMREMGFSPHQEE
jgi:hypothetical protein